MMVAPRSHPLLDRLYGIGIVIKGIDGAIELLVGIILWAAPRTVHVVLAALLGETRETGVAVSRSIGDYVARLDNDLARSGVVFLIAFLVIHGAVKIALVYCLLRKYHRAYPVALVILTVFLGYQIYALVTSPSLSMVVFTVLDAAIIYLVFREYQILKPAAGGAREADSARDSVGG